MSESINTPSTIELLQRAYNKMMYSWDRYTHCPDSLQEHYKIVYQIQLNNYRDMCVRVVEKLISSNPEALQEIEIWKKI